MTELNRLQEYEDRLRMISREYDHSVHVRSVNQIELVRTYGDQVDSRFDIKLSDDEIECKYTLWVEGEGNRESDTIYEDVQDYNFLEKIEEVMINSNKEYLKEVINRGGNVNEC